MLSKLMRDDTPIGERANSGDLLKIKVDLNLITSMCIIIFAYSNQFQTFNTYGELNQSSNKRYA